MKALVGGGLAAAAAMIVVMVGASADTPWSHPIHLACVISLALAGGSARALDDAARRAALRQRAAATAPVIGVGLGVTTAIGVLHLFGADDIPLGSALTWSLVLAGSQLAVTWLIAARLPDRTADRGDVAGRAARPPATRHPAPGHGPDVNAPRP